MSNIRITELCDIMDIMYKIQIKKFEKITEISIKIKMGENKIILNKHVDIFLLEILKMHNKDINHIIKQSFQEAINKLIPVDKIFDNICWDNLVTS